MAPPSAPHSDHRRLPGRAFGRWIAPSVSAASLSALPVLVELFVDGSLASAQLEAAVEQAPAIGATVVRHDTRSSVGAALARERGIAQSVGLAIDGRAACVWTEAGIDPMRATAAIARAGARSPTATYVHARCDSGA
jgi:hypothetical protein